MLKRAMVFAVFLLAFGVCGVSVRAQGTPQQWTFVTTSESVPNAAPLLDPNGDPVPCTGQDPNDPGDSNPNCYNPLVVTTDWNVTQALGLVLGASVRTDLTETNSICSMDSGVATATSLNETPGIGTNQVTFVVTLDSGVTITYQGQLSNGANQFTGTFSSTGSCMNGDSGNFTATLFPQVNGTYAGQFEASSGGQGVTITLATDSNFNVTGTITPDPEANSCFSDMTVATSLANSYSSSFASGEVLFAVASDNANNVVVFVASNTDANGATLPEDSLFFTYYGVAGACMGTYEVDAPFQKVQKKSPRHPPVRLKLGHGLRDQPSAGPSSRRPVRRDNERNYR